MASGTSSGCIVHHAMILSNFVKSSAIEAISIKSSSTMAGSLLAGILLRGACSASGYHPGLRPVYDETLRWNPTNGGTSLNEALFSGRNIV
jgi:hypothetical protein